MPLTYYAQEDKYGYPIPGTMMATSYSTVPKVANIITIPAQNVVSAKVHPKGLRYFVRRKSDGSIIPNSLIIGTKPPAQGLYYEFKLV